MRGAVGQRFARGAVFYAAAFFPAEAVRVTGEARHWKHRHFCPTCGGSEFARWDGKIEFTSAPSTNRAALPDL